jgi:hypothetical protein
MIELAFCQVHAGLYRSSMQSRVPLLVLNLPAVSHP